MPIIILFLSAFSLLLTSNLVYAQTIEKVAEIDVGRAPHGLRVKDGFLYLVAAGDDAIEIIDLKTLKITKKWSVPNTPMGLVSYKNGWLVSQFRGGKTVFLNGQTGVIEKSYNTGAGSSLFIPDPVGDKRYLVSEMVDKFTIFEGDNMSTYKTGKRPYPADVTKDGVLAFIPSKEDSTVTVIDLLNKKELATVPVCKNPEGGMLTRDQVNYVVVCGGDNTIAFVNTASFKVIKTISKGIGPNPFSIAMSKSGRYAFVNNYGGVDVSVVDLETDKVIKRLPAGKKPVVIRVEGDFLYVASEVSDTLSIFKITDPVKKYGSAKNQLFVMGMIHDGHLTSKRFGLDKVEEIIRAYNPDYVIAEIPPNRIESAIKGFNETGVITEPRTKRFAEHRGVVFPLMKELNYKIFGGAGWTEPMNNYRNATIKKLADDPAWAEARAKNKEAVIIANKAHNDRDDDPYYINSDEYDAHAKKMLTTYDHYYNDVYGPGGWTNINKAHYAAIEKALDELKGQGKRILITYGAGHKYWFLEQLRKRDDINLVDIKTVMNKR